MPAKCARGGFVTGKRARPALCFAHVPVLQLPIPWALRALVQRPLTPLEEFLEVLVRDGEPLLAEWARNVRGRIKTGDDLADELWRLELAGGPVARTLATSVTRSWEQFVGASITPSEHSRLQRPLPIR